LLFSSYIEKKEDNEVLYDALMDTMDLIWGGGVARGNGFYPTELTSEMIDAERKKRAQEGKDAD